VVGDALFPDRPELRTLVRSYRQAPPPKDQLPSLLPLLDAPESPTRRLALLELYHRPELRATVDAESVKPLKKLLASEQLPPLTRDYLLRVTLGLPEKLQGSWMAEAARQAIDDNEQPVDLASPIPALLITAVEVVEETGSKKDLDRLRPLLASNNPGVAKATLEALRTLDPDAARAAAKETLEAGRGHAETRRVLEAFLAGSG
jgi:HEAT repeat protein